MRTILVSAYACNPSKGSEDGNGFNYALELQKAGNKIVCFTKPSGQKEIEKLSLPDNLIFIYIKLPFGLDFLYSFSRSTMYLHYLCWQWLAYKKALNLNKIYSFDIIHHVSWGSLQLGSFLYKLKIPFIFGPAGGGQVAPLAFKKYFKEFWSVEVKREKTSNLLGRLNPGLKPMLGKAKNVIVSNIDTMNLAKKLGAKKTSLLLDCCLPDSFFPSQFPVRNYDMGLNLLWIGRLLPRKGILLVSEVMLGLKNYKDIKLTIVGDGEMRNHLEKELVAKELTNINYVGSVPFAKVKEYYFQNDVFFFTSLRDSCPAQLFEAMAYGLPVITLKLHGQDAIVNDSVGIKCSAMNPEDCVKELTEAILDLYNNKDRLRKLSISAFEYAKKQTWSNQIKKIINELY